MHINIPGISLSYAINVTMFRISDTIRPALSPPAPTRDHRPDPKSTDLKDEDQNVDLHKRVATTCPATRRCKTKLFKSGKNCHTPCVFIVLWLV